MSESRPEKHPQNRFERHPRLTLIAALFGSLTIVLLAAELIASWIHPLGTERPLEYRVPHPLLGWVLKPGTSYIYHLPEESIPVSYNADGWRDRLRTKDKAKDTLRVIVLGDLFMEAYSVRFEEALSARLESLLSTAGDPVEVINLGVGGYGTLQQYLVFNTVGRAYQPDIVVLAMYLANDLKDNSYEIAAKSEGKSLKKAARPYLDAQATESGWKITQVDFEGALRRYEDHMRLQGYALNRLIRSSALLQLAHNSLSGWPKAKAAGAEAGDNKKHLSRFGKYYCRQPPEYDRAWTLTKRILARLDHEVRETGARLLIMSVPAIQEVDEDMMADVERAAPEKVCMREPPLYRQLDELLDELDIEYLDLLAAFREAQRQAGVDLFRKVDLHWNSRGHALAAGELAAILKHRGYLGARGADTKN